MMGKILQYLKDSSKLSLVMTAFFFAGILFSAYSLYTLQQNLIFSQAIHVIDSNLARAVILKPSIIILVTFALGIYAINLAQKSVRQVTVFVDKKVEDGQNNTTTTEGEGESIDVTTFRQSLQTAKASEFIQQGLNTICKQLEAGQGAIYQAQQNGSQRHVELKQGFALSMGESQTIRFEFGEGLVGQAAASGRSIYLDEVPEGYITIVSGLGKASPRYLFIVPLKVGDEVRGVLEIATFKSLSESSRKQIEGMAQVLGEKLN